MINECKNWFFEKINNIGRLLGQLTKRNKEMSQISRNRNEQGNIKTDGKEIQKTVREKFKNLYSIKLENLKEVDGFLDSAKLPKLKQEDVIKLNRPITNVAIRIVVKAFKAKNSQRQIIAGFKQTFEEIYIQTFLSHKKKKLDQKQKEYSQTPSMKSVSL